MEKQDLIVFLNDIFFPLKFKRKGNNWVHNGDVLTKIINLQKSNFSNRYYINYGFIIRKLKLTTTTHIGYRLALSDQKRELRLTDLLDLDYIMNNEERFSELREIFWEKIVPKIQMINTEDQLLAEIKTLPYSSAVPGVVKEHFNLRDWHGKYSEE